MIVIDGNPVCKAKASAIEAVPIGPRADPLDKGNTGVGQ